MKRANLPQRAAASCGRGTRGATMLLVAALASPALGQATPTPTPALTAGDWLARTRAAYQQCATYRDSGTASRTSVRPDGAPGATTTVRFDTAFRRPDHLRFAAQYPIAGQSAEGGAILLIDGHDVQLWNRSAFGEGVSHPRSLADAVIGAVANSAGVASDVPALLVWPALRGAVRDTLELESPVLLDAAPIGDVACVRVQGAIRPDGRCTLWIDPSSALLRRIERSFAQGPLAGSTTIDLAPVIGQPVAAETFALNIPRSAAAASPAAATIPQPQGNEPAAQAILDKVWAAYAGCRSYRDRGKSVNTFTVMGRPMHLDTTFATAFDRPGRWRFSVVGPFAAPDSLPTTLAVDGDRVSMAGPGVDRSPIRPSTALDALRLGRLLSLGALADTLPLLLPQSFCEAAGAPCLRRLHGARRLDDAARDGATLIRVAGSLGADGAATLWIDPATSLIRAIEVTPAKHLGGDDAGVTVIDFHPEIDVTLTPEELRAPSTP